MYSQFCGGLWFCSGRQGCATGRRGRSIRSIPYSRFLFNRDGEFHDDHLVLGERHRLHRFRSLDWSPGEHRKSNRNTDGSGNRYVYDHVLQFIRQLSGDVRNADCHGTSPGSTNLNSRIEFHR
jgi:hypothetical protein